jgi:hypothetical protein
VLKRLLSVGIFLAAVAFPASGAVAIIQHVSGRAIGTGSSVSCALTSTGASRNIIVGAVSTFSVGMGAVVVSSVVDDRGNTYVQAPGSRGLNAGSLHGSEIWHSLNTVAGVTVVTVTFSAGAITYPYYKACFAYEVSGSMTFDTASKVDVGTCDVTNVCTGAAAITATTTGFVLGIIVVDPVNQNPNSGNEFTSGGDIDLTGNGASASLISSTASSHGPAWHSTLAGDGFTSSTSAYKQ